MSGTEPAPRVWRETIAIATAWYGSLPPWWRLTLRTMAANPDVDFILIGDFPVPSHPLPPNVKLHSLSWRALRRRVRERLGVRVWGGVRKLCDLKPTFGDLFAPELEGYDWWGWADLDVVYGDVRGQLETFGMADLDVISTYSWHASSGPLMLIRNRDDLNRLYRMSPDWKRALRRRAYVAFDEWWGDRGYVDFAAVVRAQSECGLRTARAQLMADNRAYSSNDEVTGFSGRRCRWDDGVLTAIDDDKSVTFEVLYFHFIDWKTQAYYADLASLGDRADEIASFALSEDEFRYSLASASDFGKTGSKIP